MAIAPELVAPSDSSATDAERWEHLQEQIEHAAHLLPAQGPISVFVHHNTLHAFEELPFERAVRQGWEVFSGQPYLFEQRYRELLAEERILPADVEAVLRDDLGEAAGVAAGPFGTRWDLRLAMLRHPIREAPRNQMRWLAEESDALERFSPDAPEVVRRRLIGDTRHGALRDLQNAPPLAGFDREPMDSWTDATWESYTLHLLWNACLEGVRAAGPQAATRATSVRHRDVLHAATGVDIDRPVHELLQRFCAAFLDQGLAHWSLPRRDEGFYRSFLALYGGARVAPDQRLRGLGAELTRLDRDGIRPLASIEESLVLLGVDEQERESFLAKTLLALRGWAGMIWQTETRSDRTPRPSPAGSLIEFVAVRLVLERLALANVARDALGFTGPLAALRSAAKDRAPNGATGEVERRAFPIFQLAQVAGRGPEALRRLSAAEWQRTLDEVESFCGLERRRVFHLAYERRYRVRALDALSVHCGRPARRIADPGFQVVCCIDDREESLRRHLEEIEPRCETFGAAGSEWALSCRDTIGILRNCNCPRLARSFRTKR